MTAASTSELSVCFGWMLPVRYDAGATAWPPFCTVGPAVSPVRFTVASPLLSDAVASTVVPSLNCTVPVGVLVPASGRTSALTITG